MELNFYFTHKSTQDNKAAILMIILVSRVPDNRKSQL